MVKMAAGIIRAFAGLGAIPTLFLLYRWTEATARIQESGPQLLQVYTRSAFYGVVVVGTLLALYVLSRVLD